MAYRVIRGDSSRIIKVYVVIRFRLASDGDGAR